MSLTHQCPSCAHITEGVPEDWVGRVVRCKVCGERSKVLEMVTPVKGAKREEGIREIKRDELSREPAAICRCCGNDARLNLACEECDAVLCSERCLREHTDNTHKGGVKKQEPMDMANGHAWLAIIFVAASLYFWPAFFLGGATGLSLKSITIGTGKAMPYVSLLVVAVAWSMWVYVNFLYY